MVAFRLPGASLAAIIFLLIASPTSTAFATGFDYTAIWAHLTDMEVDHYVYDCGGLVDMAVKGNMAYAIDDHYGLQVVDWRDPTSIVYRGFLFLDQPRRCAVRDHYVYIITAAQQIDIVDVDDHDAPVLVNQVPLDAMPTDIAVLGPWLYLATSDDTLLVFALGSATSPILANTVVLPPQLAERLELEFGRLVAAGDAGLVVLDTSVPDWPAIRGSLTLPGDTRDLAVRDDLALLGQSDRTRLVDISDPGAMIQVAELPEPGEGVRLTSNGQAWIGWVDCWPAGGLRIYDVNAPASPVWLHDVIQGFRGGPVCMVEARGLVFAAESMCWCAGEWPGFHIFQLGDLPLPEPLAVENRNGCQGLVAWDSQVDLATNSGIESWDLSDPQAPVLDGTVGAGSGFDGLVEDDGLLVTCRSQYGGPYWMQVLSRDPAGALVPRGNLQLGGLPSDLDLSGSRAMVAHAHQHGATLVDLSNPDAPVVVANLLETEDLTGAALNGDLAALASDQLLRLIDLADPQNPVELAAVPHGAYFHRSYLDFRERDGRLWLLASRNASLNYDGGFADLFDVTDPTNPQLVSAMRQLGMNTVGPMTWHDDLLIVPSEEQLTFYAFSGGAAGPEYAGRVQVADEWPPLTGRWAVVAGQSVATVAEDGKLQIRPLPIGAVTAARDAPDGGAAPWTASLDVSAAPNPFNPTCEIRFDLPTAGSVVVAIYDAQGRHVRTLLPSTLGAGPHSVGWDGRNGAGQAVAAGVYLARIAAGGSTASVKLTLAK